MSDDVEAATHKLLIRENLGFDIVFPGVGDIGSPGTQDLFANSYSSIDLYYKISASTQFDLFFLFLQL